MTWKPALVFLLLLGALGIASAATVNMEVGWVIGPPRVETDPATNITLETAILHGNLTGMGIESPTVNISFEWGTTLDLGLETDSQERSTTGDFQIPLVGLERNVQYYFRAKAVGNGTAYGDILNFTTEASEMTPQDVVILVSLVLIGIFFVAGLVLDRPLGPMLWVFGGITCGMFAMYLFNVTSEFYLTAIMTFFGIFMIIGGAIGSISGMRE